MAPRDSGDEVLEKEAPVGDDEKSLYDKIVDVTRIEYDAEVHETHDGYKDAVARYLLEGDYKDMGEEDFVAAVGQDIADWHEATCDAIKANRGARTPKALPHLSGLDAPLSEKAPSAARTKEKTVAAKEKVAKSAAKEKTARPAAVKKNHEPRGPSRFLRAFRMLIKDPNVSLDVLAKEVGVSVSIARGDCRAAFKAAGEAFAEAGLLKK